MTVRVSSAVAAERPLPSQDFGGQLGRSRCDRGNTGAGVFAFPRHLRTSPAPGLVRTAHALQKNLRRPGTRDANPGRVTQTHAAQPPSYQSGAPPAARTGRSRGQAASGAVGSPYAGRGASMTMHDCRHQPSNLITHSRTRNPLQEQTARFGNPMRELGNGTDDILPTTGAEHSTRFSGSQAASRAGAPKPPKPVVLNGFPSAPQLLAGSARWRGRVAAWRTHSPGSHSGRAPASGSCPEHHG